MFSFCNYGVTTVLTNTEEWLKCDSFKQLQIWDAACFLHLFLPTLWQIYIFEIMSAELSKISIKIAAC